MYIANETRLTGERRAGGAITGRSMFGNSVSTERFTEADRAYGVLEFYQNNSSAIIGQRKFRGYYHLHNFNVTLSVQTIKNCVVRFERTSSVLDIHQSSWYKRSRTNENINNVTGSNLQDLTLPTCKRSRIFDISLQRILTKVYVRNHGKLSRIEKH